MRRTLLTIAICIALAVVAVAVFAQDGPTPPAPPKAPAMAVPDTVRTVPSILPTLRFIGPQMVPMLSARLNLTDDQKTKMSSLLQKAETDIKPKVENQVKLAREYTSLLTDPNTNQEQLIAAGEKQMKAETEVLLARIQTLFALKALLTPEQNRQFSEYLTLHTRPWREISAAPGRPDSNAKAPAAE